MNFVLSVMLCFILQAKAGSALSDRINRKSQETYLIKIAQAPLPSFLFQEARGKKRDHMSFSVVENIQKVDGKL